MTHISALLSRCVVGANLWKAGLYFFNQTLTNLYPHPSVGFKLNYVTLPAFPLSPSRIGYIFRPLQPLLLL